VRPLCTQYVVVAAIRAYYIWTLVLSVRPRDRAYIRGKRFARWNARKTYQRVRTMSEKSEAKVAK